MLEGQPARLDHQPDRGRPLLGQTQIGPCPLGTPARPGIAAQIRSVARALESWPPFITQRSPTRGPKPTRRGRRLTSEQAGLLLGSMGGWHRRKAAPADRGGRGAAATNRPEVDGAAAAGGGWPGLAACGAGRPAAAQDRRGGVQAGGGGPAVTCGRDQPAAVRRCRRWTTTARRIPRPTGGRTRTPTARP